MTTTSLIAFVRGKLRDFRRAKGGNVAIIFGLSAIPVVGLMGAAADYSRANSAKAAMQAAVDATALMLSKEVQSLNNTQLNEKALKYFLANFNRPDAQNIVVTPNYLPATSELQLLGEATLNTHFVSLLGKETMAISATSTAKWGNSRLRVALALDNTGSMASSNKMVALKAASHKLLDQLQKAASKDGDVYVSIVPFAKDVNVGAGDPNNASWKAPDWVDFETNRDGLKSWDNKYGTCSGGWRNQWGTRDKDNCKSGWAPNHHNTWNGCVADRDEDYDVTNTPPSTQPKLTETLFPAEQASNCPVALMPQTYNWADLRAKIDSMTPTGNTNTTIGLEWAWHSLSQNAPLNAPPIVTSGGIITRNIIIFLTDGENTENRTSNSSRTIDRRMKKACQNAKDKNIVIYTVLVMQGNETLLQECASPTTTDPKGPKFFKLTSSDQLVTTFEQIGTALSALRIAN
jgi:Flp pilus assembly protein TadG